MRARGLRRLSPPKALLPLLLRQSFLPVLDLLGEETRVSRVGDHGRGVLLVGRGGRIREVLAERIVAFSPRFSHRCSRGKRKPALPETLSPPLEDLESESIYVLREAGAQFAKPVLLYSIGKDSSVLLHLARKAFFPAKPPVPLLHIDSRVKFGEMIAFRDAAVKRLGLELIVHVHEEGVARNINPIDSGSALPTRVMKTEALKQALQR